MGEEFPPVAAPSDAPPSESPSDEAPSLAPASAGARSPPQSAGRDGDGPASSKTICFAGSGSVRVAEGFTFADAMMSPDGRSISATRSHEGNVTRARHGSVGEAPLVGQRFASSLSPDVLRGRKTAS